MSEKPRYTVGSVTGYPITPAAGKIGSTRPPVTIWYVHDSAYCYRVVRVFKQRNPEERARAFAAELNAPPAVPHPEAKPPTQKRSEWAPDPRWKKKSAQVCRNGHPVNWLNTLITPSGIRRCRVCRTEREQRRSEAA